MEINYRNKNGEIEYFIFHDGSEFSEQAAIEHFRNNGHTREPIHIYAPWRLYQKMSDIARRIESAFKIKETRRTR